MINRGEVKFCPGCPFTGNFVGPIKPGSVHKSYLENLVLIDNDGLESDRLKASLSESFDDELIFEELQSRIVQRISECVGIVRHPKYKSEGEYIRCPALSGHDVMHKLIESVTETIGSGD